jgi:hypothetical protein
MTKENCEYFYWAFGLTIGSCLEIPELIPVEEIPDEPDVLIRGGSVPESLENPKNTGVRFQASPNCFLLKVDNIAKFLVSDGCRITVELVPGAEARDIRCFMLGSAFGALIHQRGLLPLHASAIKVNSHCVVFCGISGSGKSTTAKAFIKRGYPLHTDDICVISSSVNGTDGTLIAYPGYPQLKLWEDTLNKIGISSTSYSRVRSTLDKFAIPIPDRFNQEPLPIKNIYILSPWLKGELELSDVTGMNKFNALKKYTFRFRFVEGLDQELPHFKITGLVGNRVPIRVIQRPQSLFLVDQLVDLLEKDFSE